MYGLFPALMETQRFRADQDQRAADAEMRRQEMGMRQQEFGLRQQETQGRLADAERKRRISDELVQSLDEPPPDAAANMAPGPAHGLNPSVRADMEANGVDVGGPAPVAGLRPVGSALTGVDRAAARALAASGDVEGLQRVRADARTRQIGQWKSTRLKELMDMPQEQLATMAAKFSASDAPVWFNFNPKNKDKPFEVQSQVPGVPTRKLSPVEMAETILGAELAGQGNYDEGVKILSAKMQTQRAMQEADRADSLGLAKSTADVYFKGRAADATDAQRAEQTRHNRALEAKAGGGAGGSKVDPKLLAEYNNLVAEYQAAVDSGDSKREMELRKQLPIKQAQMATAMNKTLSLRDPPAGRVEPGIKVNADGTILKDGVLYERGRDGQFAPVKGLGPSALDRAIERKTAGGAPGAPAMGLAPPTQDSPEMQTARAVQGMNAAQFSAYKRMQENQPLSPRERDLLRAAGIQIP